MFRDQETKQNKSSEVDVCPGGDRDIRLKGEFHFPVVFTPVSTEKRNSQQNVMSEWIGQE